MAEARDAAQDIADRGIATFKIKVGATDWSHDVERVVTARGDGLLTVLDGDDFVTLEFQEAHRHFAIHGAVVGQQDS